MIQATVAVAVGTLVLLFVWSAGNRIIGMSGNRLRPVTRAILGFLLAASVVVLQRIFGVATVAGSLAIPLLIIVPTLAEVLWRRSLAPVRRPGLLPITAALFACSLSIFLTAALLAPAGA